MPSATGLMSIIGALILGLALAYAMIRNRKRNRRAVKIGEAAAREEFLHPSSYNPQKFRNQLQLRLKRRDAIRRR